MKSDITEPKACDFNLLLKCKYEKQEVKGVSRGWFNLKFFFKFVLTKQRNHILRANQQKANLKFYSWTQYNFSVNKYDRRILSGKKKKIRWIEVVLGF